MDLLEREFGLTEDEFDRFSFLADHISEQYAHLLIQDPNSIVIGDWLGAFCNETPRPTFLFQTSQSFCPDSVLDSQELSNPSPATSVYTIGDSAPSLIRLHSHPPGLRSWNGRFKKVSVYSLQKRQGPKEIMTFRLG